MLNNKQGLGKVCSVLKARYTCERFQLYSAANYKSASGLRSALIHKSPEFGPCCLRPSMHAWPTRLRKSVEIL